MKRIVLFCVAIIAFCSFGFTQCTPNPDYTILGIPGVYPPAQQFGQDPIFGIDDGMVNTPYSETITIIVVEDTTLDIAFLLPAGVVAAMNVAGISTVMNVAVNHITYDVGGLPNGLTYACNQNNCQYLSGADGCILLDGTPTQGGNFTVPVNMTINIQIPPIADPLLGTTIFAGMATDLPSFTAQEYDLFIDGGISSVTEINHASTLYPNPTTRYATLKISTIADVKIYNTLGEIVFVAQDVQGEIKLSKSDIGIGIFYITVLSANKEETLKLIMKH